jgi:hypothetical protein
VQTGRSILDFSDLDEDIDAYKPGLPPSAVEERLYKEEEDNEEHCSICLQPLSDRTIIPACSHEFCFECLLVWTGPCQCFISAFTRMLNDDPSSILQNNHEGVHCAPGRLRNT